MFNWSILSTMLICGWSAVAMADVFEDEELEVLVVTGTRSPTPLGDSPVAVETIGREEIEASGVENVAALLEGYPGVVITRSYVGAAVRLQGLAPEHVLILIDGERVLGAKDGVIDLSRYSVEHIERIEMVKGPSSSLYGSDAMGGVINIITRSAREPLSGTLHIRAGNYGTTDVSGTLGVKRNRWESQTNGGFHANDSYDLNPDDVATTGSAVEQMEVSNQTKLTINSDIWMTGRASYLKRDQTGVDLSNSGAVFDRTNRIEDVHVSLKPRFLTNTNGRISVDGAFSYYRDQYLSDQRDSNALDTLQDTREHLGTATIQYDQTLFKDHFVTAGVEGIVQAMSSERLEEGEGQRNRAAVYLQDQWDLGLSKKRLTLVPGGRLDLDSWFGVHPTPKIALRFDPTSTFVWRTSYGWGYRAPAFKELLLLFENPGAGYMVEGNPDLMPETSQSVQVGFEHKLTDWLWYSVNGYHNDVEQLIGIGTLEEGSAGQLTRYGYVNIASAYTQGVETMVRFKSDYAKVRLGYVLTNSLDREMDRPLEGRAVHQGTFGLSTGIKKIGLKGSVSAVLFGARPYYVDTDDDGLEDTVISDPYQTFDVRLAQKVATYGELFVGVDNVTDAGDSEFLTIPPRFVYAGITGRFQSSEKTSAGRNEHDEL